MASTKSIKNIEEQVSSGSASLGKLKSKVGKMGILLGLLGALLLWVGTSYNGLVKSENNVNTLAANLQSAYQRRADLVPNLVSTVKGAANFESDTLNKVVEARAKATSTNIDLSKATPEQIAAFSQTQSDLTSSIRGLLAVVESYPSLTATQNFRDLQTQLEGTENRINVERNKFNEGVNDYNNKVRVFPGTIVAKLFGFDKKNQFQATAGAESSPKVDFTTPTTTN